MPKAIEGRRLTLSKVAEVLEATGIMRGSITSPRIECFTPHFLTFTTLKLIMSQHKEVKRITTNTLLKMKQTGEKIAMLTAYDFSFARLIDAAGIDVILVGDSASNVMAGHETTLPITLDQMIYHAQSVIRGISHCLVIVDLPFGTYQSNSDVALASAVRIMKETGAHAIKLEGGAEAVESIKRIVSAGIPVMGHLGLTPQSIYKFGTYNVRAKEEAEAGKLKEDALLLQEAGCFGMVLEKIPATLAKEVTQSLIIPTIGIGAGAHCDGQVLVMHDMLGINSEFKPRFLRQYLQLHALIDTAVKHYIKDVKEKDFPSEKESY
jgi:3-methyl-2-oxobutanoate hydroxymethyltransferase